MNSIVEDSEELAEDFREQVHMHVLLTRYADEKQAAIEAEARDIGFVDLPEPDESDTPVIPLVGPDRPQVIVCVVAADLNMQPYHWN